MAIGIAFIGADPLLPACAPFPPSDPLPGLTKDPHIDPPLGRRFALALPIPIPPPPPAATIMPPPGPGTGHRWGGQFKLKAPRFNAFHFFMSTPWFCIRFRLRLYAIPPIPDPNAPPRFAGGLIGSFFVLSLSMPFLTSFFDFAFGFAFHCGHRRRPVARSL